MGVIIIKIDNQQGPMFVVECQVPYLVLGNRPVNSVLTICELMALLHDVLLNLLESEKLHTKNHSMIAHARHT